MSDDDTSLGGAGCFIVIGLVVLVLALASVFGVYAWLIIGAALLIIGIIGALP